MPPPIDYLSDAMRDQAERAMRDQAERAKSDAPVEPERHISSLAEHHEITLPIGDRGFVVTRDQCRLAAEDWAESQGLELMTMTDLVEDGRVGVSFTVLLGNGGADPAGWIWSGRTQYWRDQLTGAAKRRSSRLHPRGDGMASVSAIGAGIHSGGGVPGGGVGGSTVISSGGVTLRAGGSGDPHRHASGTGPRPDFSGFGSTDT